MTKIGGLAFAAVLAVVAIAPGCSSNDHSSPNKGNLTMSLKATGSASGAAATATAKAGAPAPADQEGGPTAASITISGASVKTPDGTWIPMVGSFPVVVDVIALATSGAGVTLPADVVPAGHYEAIQITITAVNLTLHDGTMVAITPPGTGWEVMIAVSFDVVAGQQTVVTLNLRCDHSFHFLNGEFEFDPDIEVEDVEHHDD
jgi:hypothetical protein